MKEHDCLREEIYHVLHQYDFRPLGVNPYKLIYRVKTVEGVFALKEIKYPEDEFWYIYSAMEHLASHGFPTINRVILTKDYYPYAEYQGKRYALSRWIQGREADYSHKGDLKIAAQTLALLHKASQGFIPPPWEERIKWGTWPESMMGKMNQLYDFRNTVSLKNRKTLFDRIFLAHVDYYIGECKKSLDLIGKGDYAKVNEKDAAKNYFCHHDFAHHNVIIDEKGRGNVIDFDYCISDVRCHDLGSLMLRVLKRSGWDVKQAVFALKHYDKVRSVSAKETGVIKILLRFPQDFWQVAFAYYIEQNQPTERLLKKIKSWVLNKPLREKSLRKLAKLI
ncbi:MAG: CotS family spore coat protein [Bacillota bacterium]|jgi:CotS family spore coat protein|nr:CotS family spore coat protein [Clostridia bacterium]